MNDLLDGLPSVDLCSDCGASWWCEHRDGEAPTRPLKERTTFTSSEIATYLHTVAAAVENGLYDADAVLIVLTEGDIHRPYWTGHNDWSRLSRAADAPNQHRWNKDATPEQLAERRAKLQAIREAEAEAARQAEPYICECNNTFKTERGHTAHQRHYARNGWGGKHGLATIYKAGNAVYG